MKILIQLKSSDLSSRDNYDSTSNIEWRYCTNLFKGLNKIHIMHDIMDFDLKGKFIYNAFIWKKAKFSS